MWPWIEESQLTVEVDERTCIVRIEKTSGKKVRASLGHKCASAEEARAYALGASNFGLVLGMAAGTHVHQDDGSKPLEFRQQEDDSDDMG